MHRHTLKYVLPLCFLASCTQANLDALENATVLCDSDADCTDGFYCETRLDPQQCRDVNDRDDQDPELVSRSITPEAGTVGTELTATFEVNEPVMVDQLNVYFEGGLSFEYDEAASDPDSNTFAFKRTLTGEERESPQRLVRAFVKDQGGSSTDLDLGDVAVDFTAPSATGRPNLSGYRAGDEVVYQVTVTEALSTGVIPVLEILKDGEAVPNFLVADGQNTDNPLMFEYTSSSLNPADSGAYTVSISGLKDALGNEPATAVAGEGFTVQSTLPDIYKVSLDEGMGSFKSLEEVVFDFCVTKNVSDENIHTRFLTETKNVVVRCEGQGISASCQRTGANDEAVPGFNVSCWVPEGGVTDNPQATTDAEPSLVPVFIQTFDEVGNMDVANSLLKIDLNPPGVLSVQLSSSLYGLGNRVLIDLFFDEPLAKAPTISVNGDANFFELPIQWLGSSYFTSGSVQSITLQQNGVFQLGEDGLYNIEISNLEDKLGNASSSANLCDAVFHDCSFEVDTVAPVLQIEDLGADNRFSSESPHNEIAVGVNLNGEPLENLVVTLEGYLFACTADSTTHDATCRLPSAQLEMLLAEPDFVGQERTRPVLFSIRDSAGNEFTGSITAVLDEAPPEVMAAQVTYEPSQSNVLSAVPAAKNGTAAVLTFSTDEGSAVADVAVVCPDHNDGPPPGATNAPSHVSTNDANTLHTYRWVVNGSVTETACFFRASVADLVGNSRDRDLVVLEGAGEVAAESLVQIDNVPPDAPHAFVAGLKHVRIPFGAVQSGHQPAQYIADRNVGNFTPLDVVAAETAVDSAPEAQNDEWALVQFFDAPVAGTKQAQTVQLTHALKLNSVDSTALYAEVVDLSGNISERVRLTSELVSTFSPDPNSYTSNPVRWLEQGPTPAQLPGSVLSAVAEMDGATSSSHPAAWAEKSRLPDVRYGHSAAYDSARGVTVVFGGMSDAGTLLSDTWEYDGVTWREVGLTDPEGDDDPPVRRYHKMVYDSARGVVVLFGGDNGNILGDTWEYNGSSWRLVTPSDAEGDGDPSARKMHGLVYDADRGVTVLFGGTPNGSNGFVDTWEYDGQRWVEVARFSTTRPSNRFGHSLAYDSDRNKVILFGGYYYGQSFNDTWEYDGSEWQEVTTGNEPLGRFHHELVYDSVREVVVLFGGFRNVTGEGMSIRRDLWEYDGDNWQLILDNNAPGNAPSRYNYSLTHDTSRGRTVLFGGFSSNIIYADTWEYDGTALTEVGLSPPDGRSGFDVAYDAAREVAVLFGGRKPGETQNDTWEYDGNRWNQRSDVTPVPSKRYDHSLAYDAHREVSVLFGGKEGQLFGDTWEYDGVGWTAIAPTDPEGDGNPVARKGHSTVYDASRNVLVLFGGLASGDMELNDTWEYDGVSWRDVSSNGVRPPERGYHRLTYDANRAVVVLFGGAYTDTATEIRFEDTWEYDGDQWTRIFTDDPEGDGDPIGRSAFGLAYDLNRGVAVLNGGEALDATGAITVLSDSWEYDGNSWRRTDLFDVATKQTARREHRLFYDEARYEIVLFGGNDEVEGSSLDTYYNDTLAYANSFGGMSLPLQQMNFPPESLLSVSGILVVRHEPSQMPKMRLGAQTSSYEAQPDQTARTVAGEWETITQTVSAPAQVSQLVNPFDTQDEFVSFRFNTEVLNLNEGLKPAEIDYLELRLLYDLDHDNTQVEATCGDGVMQPWLGEACDDLNTEDGDYCSADCTQELAWCGDGAIQANAGEVCDGESDTHWCSSDCWFRLAKPGAEDAFDGGLGP